jgi:hypothetical protein
MIAQRLARRRMLRGAGALGMLGAVTALAGQERVHADADASSLGPVSQLPEAQGPAVSVLGTWLETITSPDNVFPAFQTLTTYAAGGGLISTASIDLNPATLGSGAFGAWVGTGDRTFRWFAHAFAYTPQGAPNGLFNIRESVALDQAGDTYSGTGGYQIVNNGTVLFAATVKLTATRVTA